MSFVKVDSTRLAEMCQETIDRIKAYREKLDKEYIDRELKSRNWWRMILSFGLLKPLTWDEVKESTPETFPYYPSINGWGALDRAEKLLILTKYSDTVNLSVEDVDLIS